MFTFIVINGTHTCEQGSQYHLWDDVQDPREPTAYPTSLCTSVQLRVRYFDENSLYNG